MIVTRIPIRNVIATDLTVHVEPWGEQHVLREDESLEVVFYGPASGKPEILIGDSGISVYAWEDCRVFVLRNNLCVSQPGLIKVIDRICASEGIDKSNLKLEPDIIDYAQRQLDKAEAWDADGRKAAFQAVAKVAPLLSRLGNELLVWRFSQTVLHSRGIFLHEDTSKYREFFSVLERSSGDLEQFLTDWHDASVKRDLLVDNVMAD